MSANQANSNQNYDIILIGSGMGALTVGSIMSQLRDKRVLILERHYVMGGFTHEFGRKQKYSWDVGIHYVGDMHEGAMLRRLSDIVTRGGVRWNQMPADCFEKFVYPDFTFRVPASEEEYLGRLIEMFPAEEAALRAYFEDVRTMNGWFGRHNMKSPEPFVDRVRQKLQISGFDTANITTADYFNKNFTDPKLRALLASQWGDYGIPPSKSPFVLHCSVVYHYFHGGYYPEGGASTIAESVKPIIEERGGRVLLSHEVEEILVENGEAKGVRVRNLRARPAKGDQEVFEFFAPVIISNAGAHLTYNKLLPESVEIPFRQQLNDFYKKHSIVSSVTLYLGLKSDPRELPHEFRGENHWIFAGYDHDTNFAGDAQWMTGDAPVSGAYMSFPSLKNKQAKAHTAEIIGLTEFAPFQKWAESTTWKKRGEDYEALKEKIAKKLIAYVDSRYPGFADLVEFYELSTPLTTNFFTGHFKGSIYGVPSVRERFVSSEAPWCQANTPVKNLYLTGADASSPGIAGALMGAMATIGTIPDGVSFIRLLKETKEMSFTNEAAVAGG